MKRIGVLVTTLLLIGMMSLSSVASASYTHKYENKKEIVRVSSSGGSYNAYAYAWVGRLDNVKLGENSYSTTISTNGAMGVSAVQTLHIGMYTPQCGKYSASATNTIFPNDYFNVSGSN